MQASMFWTWSELQPVASAGDKERCNRLFFWLVEEVWLCLMEVQPEEHCSSPAKKWQGPGQEVVLHAPLERAWSFWCCVMQTGKIEQSLQCGLWRSAVRQIFHQDFWLKLDGVLVEEPSWMVKSCCRVGVAGKTCSSVFARLSCRWCSFIHAEMSARQPEIRAATVGSSGWDERYNFVSSA